MKAILLAADSRAVSVSFPPMFGIFILQLIASRKHLLLCLCSPRLFLSGYLFLMVLKFPSLIPAVQQGLVWCLGVPDPTVTYGYDTYSLWTQESLAHLIRCFVCFLLGSQIFIIQSPKYYTVLFQDPFMQVLLPSSTCFGWDLWFPVQHHSSWDTPSSTCLSTQKILGPWLQTSLSLCLPVLFLIYGDVNLLLNFLLLQLVSNF